MSLPNANIPRQRTVQVKYTWWWIMPPQMTGIQLNVARRTMEKVSGSHRRHTFKTRSGVTRHHQTSSHLHPPNYPDRDQPGDQWDGSLVTVTWSHAAKDMLMTSCSVRVRLPEKVKGQAYSEWGDKTLPLWATLVELWWQTFLCYV